LLVRLMDESLPPEVRLLNRLMAAEDDATLDKLLQENRDLLTEDLVQYLEDTEATMREQGTLETADHLASVLAKVKLNLPQT